ncbi:enoyl-[acyl-carrier-protein] reductase [NADH] [Alicyclobacillus sacchari]|uniref:Enoyl-[acyl-carrier-protein] reductase [NADH] n=1 Tax=Alicyclobacillus sacchari TaxID=392010 RepID=A0A4R8LSL5_9BACL|nr:enoyl-ACP reductase FabI [Alicyclobacillus sacchari]TDY49576.1 enoyl-[acyl-carrier-protein] reductase [NADH] [Alicyclobacillus sacchari]
MTLLAGKTVVIMGVANRRSIAWAVAESVRRLGADLIFTYRSDRAGEQLQKLCADAFPDMEPCIVPCDVNDDASIEQAFAEIGGRTDRVHGLVHSIAHARVEDLQGEFVQTSRDGFWFAHSTSAYSLVAVSRAARPLLAEGSSIVTMSYLGAERAVPNYNVMGVAKAALESAVRYLAADLGPAGIRVNAISAGPIRTLAAKGVRGFNDVLHAVEERSPLKRNVTAEEVGDATAFLVSDLSKGITGEVIHVDGGYHTVGF